MEEKTIHQNTEEFEIDIKRLVDALVKKAWLIGIAAILCAAVTFAVTFFFVTPQYESSAMFYVNNSSISLGEASVSISAGDISASRGLVQSYIVILNTRETLMDVVDYAGVDRTYSQITEMISAEAVEDTEIFRVTVTSPDPREAERIAGAVAYILPKRISSIIEGTSAKIVDSAVVATVPSSPSYSRNTVIGFLVGLVIAAAVVALRALTDISIHTEEDLTDGCRYPVLAVVPDMAGSGKDGKRYGKTRFRHPSDTKKTDRREPVGGNISFAAAEAYKLLRTKLQFSFADEQSCHVIGVSSALAGEGKSLSAVNLACSAAQLGKRVLLIDCDMRCPSLAEKLPVQNSPGLSDFLTGQSSAENLLQLSGLQSLERPFHTIASGHIPPNPMELLSSPRMSRMLELLRQKYDYILLDLPPVGEVGDALAVAKLTDGMLMVVRQDCCSRTALDNAIRQLEFVGAKILGVVFNCVSENRKPYGSRYGRKNDGRYQGGYR